MPSPAVRGELRAEWRAGELLRDMPKHNGDPRLQNATRLSDIGIEKTQSHRWQNLASLPADDFETYIAETPSGRSSVSGPRAE